MMDRASLTTTLIRSDGKQAQLPLQPSTFPRSSVLATIHYFPSLGVLLGTTQTGDDIVFELPGSVAGDAVGDRVVVYLDQNIWSEIARLRFRPEPGDDIGRAAVEQLTEWVRERRVLLPASSGHYLETTKWLNTDRRYELGLTILQLSRGWQMRHPLEVRHNEIARSLATMTDNPDAADDIFTLRPGALHGPSAVPPYPTPHDFDADTALKFQSSLSARVHIDLMLDRDPIEPVVDLRWAEVNQEFSTWLDQQTLDSRQKRKAVDAALLNDLQLEIAKAAVNADNASADQVREWWRRNPAQRFSKLPALGLYREMYQDRHLNPRTRRTSNDLVDMTYLSCGAGYADVIACETHMGGILRQGLRRLARDTKLTTNLGELISAVRQNLDE